MIPFDYHSPTRIVFGPDQVETLGELAKECGGSRILLISDPGVIEAGHTERLELEGAELDAPHLVGRSDLVEPEVHLVVLEAIEAGDEEDVPTVGHGDCALGQGHPLGQLGRAAHLNPGAQVGFGVELQGAGDLDERQPVPLGVPGFLAGPALPEEEGARDGLAASRLAQCLLQEGGEALGGALFEERSDGGEGGEPEARMPPAEIGEGRDDSQPRPPIVDLGCALREDSCQLPRQRAIGLDRPSDRLADPVDRVGVLSEERRQGLGKDGRRSPVPASDQEDRAAHDAERRASELRLGLAQAACHIRSRLCVLDGGLSDSLPGEDHELRGIADRQAAKPLKQLLARLLVVLGHVPSLVAGAGRDLIDSDFGPENARLSPSDEPRRSLE